MQVIQKLIANNEYEIAKNILCIILNRLKCNFDFLILFNS